MGDGNLFSRSIALGVILLSQTTCSLIVPEDPPKAQVFAATCAEGVAYAREENQNFATQKVYSKANKKINLQGHTMIDPKNPAGTATLTYSNEFNSLNWWNGTSGLDFAPGWHVAYNPNSTGFNAGDNATWNINPNFEGTKSANTFTVNDGILTLAAKPTDPAIAQYTNGFKYTGGQVSTFHEFSQTYGYFEMRAKLPTGSGLGSAFWLLNEDMKWPPEIDVMESVGRDPTAIFTTAHSGDANSTYTAVGSNANGPIYSNQSWSRVTDMSADFHTYGLNWQADKITWYMDGVKLFEMNTPSDMNKPMYLLAGIGVANNDWVGYATPTTTGQMQIDYLRAYSNATTTPPPAPTPDPVNHAPSDIQLTSADVLENSPNGTVSVIWALPCRI
jgi:beta-glucanase (GH16 family)